MINTRNAVKARKASMTVFQETLICEILIVKVTLPASNLDQPNCCIRAREI